MSNSCSKELLELAERFSKAKDPDSQVLNSILKRLSAFRTKDLWEVDMILRDSQ